MKTFLIWWFCIMFPLWAVVAGFEMVNRVKPGERWESLLSGLMVGVPLLIGFLRILPGLNRMAGDTSSGVIRVIIIRDETK